jgi:hypothetical protein
LYRRHRRHGSGGRLGDERLADGSEERQGDAAEQRAAAGGRA